MNKKIIFLLTFITISLTSFGADALQLSLPGKNLPQGEDVEGVRISVFHGQSENVKGVNLSTFGLSETENFTGLDLGILFGASRVKNEFRGVSLGWVNWHEGRDTGVNIAFLNMVNDVNGANLGFFNFATGDSKVNLGIVNYVEGETLVDLGFLNISDSAVFQLGFVNVTQNLDGIQIGLVNYAANGVLPVLPIVNFKKSL